MYIVYIYTYTFICIYCICIYIYILCEYKYIHTICLRVYIYIYIYIYCRTNVLCVDGILRVFIYIYIERECSPMARETWVQSQVESYQRLKKWYLMPPCLTLSIIRYGSRVKWSNPGKGVAPSPTPWCSKLSKRQPSGHPRLWSPTLLFTLLTLKSAVVVIWNTSSKNTSFAQETSN